MGFDLETNGLLRQNEARAEAPDVQAEPSTAYPVADGSVVCRCGRVYARGTDACATCGKVLEGNGRARRTALYAIPSTPELQAIEAAGRALAAQSIADAGGVEELSARAIAACSTCGS